MASWTGSADLVKRCCVRTSPYSTIAWDWRAEDAGACGTMTDSQAVSYGAYLKQMAAPPMLSVKGWRGLAYN